MRCPFVFDLVNMANEEKVEEFTRKKDVEDDLPIDQDGEQTLRFLRNTRRIVDRVTGSNSSSLGLHPVVYFYTKGGMFQPSAFLATVQFMQRLDKRGQTTALCEGAFHYGGLFICL